MATPNAPRHFSDVTDKMGLQFVHDPGPVTNYEITQITGFGGGLFDFDSDGNLDICLISGRGSSSQSSVRTVCNALFRQEPNGTFREVTAESGLENTGFGFGLAVGDADNDGDLDVFFANYGDDLFFVNRGDGTFADHTTATGVSNPNWSTAACFFDYDRDGWLDLVVVNYVDHFPGTPCYDPAQRRDFCGPQAFVGTVDRLYHNLGLDAAAGGPKFEDVTVSSGLASAVGKGLGVCCADFNGDRRPDIFVANDMEANRLWIQQPNGKFVDEAIIRGVGVNQWGQAEANMGVVFDDLTGDGQGDLFVTHLRGETNTLWHGEASGQFWDVTSESGLGAPSLASTGFGVVALDLENDGDLDVVIANGHVKRPGLAEPGTRKMPATTDLWSDYADRNQIFEQIAPGRFRLCDSSEEELTRTPGISRGLCVGDVDRDGGQDVLVTRCHGPARLYLNTTERRGSWLQVRIWDPARRRDAYGARVVVEAGGRTWSRVLQPSGSFLSHHDVWLHFGLGALASVDQIRVEWPDGEIAPEVFEGGVVNRRIELRRGAGRLQELRP